MQGGRGRGDPFVGFGDPFASFGGMPSLFGGRDPFDDPFFTHPPGAMFQPNPFGHAGSPFMGVSPFGSSLFGPNGSPFIDPHPPGVYHSQSLPNSSRGPIIEELNSDDEKEPESGHRKKENAPKHGRPARQPYVQHPGDENGIIGREVRQPQYGNLVSVMHDAHLGPPVRSFSFQSSTVTYGGSNGAYYTSSTTKRAGSDGIIFEEHKQADSVTGQAAHRISRGIHDKGHTLSRHLKSDGHVDTLQTLHNINQDELASFEENWKGKTRMHLPGWSDGINAHNVGAGGSGGWALPSTENRHDGGIGTAGAGASAGAGGYGESSRVRKR